MEVYFGSDFVGDLLRCRSVESFPENSWLAVLLCSSKDTSLLLPTNVGTDWTSSFTGDVFSKALSERGYDPVSGFSKDAEDDN